MGQVKIIVQDWLAINPTKVESVCQINDIARVDIRNVGLGIPL